MEDNKNELPGKEKHFHKKGKGIRGRVDGKVGQKAGKFKP